MLPSDLPTTQAKGLRLRVATNNRWIAGHVTTLHSRLIDALMSMYGQDIDLKEVVVGQTPYPSAEVPAVAYANVNLDAVLLALPVEGASSPTPSDPYAVLHKQPHRLRLGVGPYEVEGNIYLAEGSSLQEGLIATRAPFVLLTDAVITRADGTGRWVEPVVIVSRQRADYLMPVPAAAQAPSARAVGVAATT